MVTVSLSVAGTRVPPAGLPSAVTLLVIEPASRSARVTTWVALQVVEAAGARLLARHVAAPSLSSTTLRALIVTLPVLVTRYE